MGICKSVIKDRDSSRYTDNVILYITGDIDTLNITVDDVNIDNMNIDDVNIRHLDNTGVTRGTQKEARKEKIKELFKREFLISRRVH